jgi:hypothetical protein
MIERLLAAIVPSGAVPGFSCLDESPSPDPIGHKKTRGASVATIAQGRRLFGLLIPRLFLLESTADCFGFDVR